MRAASTRNKKITNARSGLRCQNAGEIGVDDFWVLCILGTTPGREYLLRP